MFEKETVGRRIAALRWWAFLAFALCCWLLPLGARAAVDWQLDKTVYAMNEPITVQFKDLEKPGKQHWVGIWAYPDSGAIHGAWDRASNGGSGSLLWKYLPATASGTVSLAGAAPGRYVAFLLADDGYEWLSTPIVFWVTADGVAQRESGQLSSDLRSYEEGARVQLDFRGVTAGPKNWIGVWKYVDGPGKLADGPWQFSQSNASSPWKYVTGTSGQWDIDALDPGVYAAFLLGNDGYQWLAPPAIFEVRAKPVDPSTLTGPPAFDGKSTELKVLQFNIWLQGTGVGSGGPDMIADVIRDSGADVITLSETSAAYGSRLVKDLAKRGYLFHQYGPSKDVGVVSRYPILEMAEFNRFSKAVIDVNGTPVAVYSGHLEYRWYVCYLPRGYGGGTPAGNPTSEYDWKKISSGPITDASLILDLNEKSGRPESIRQFIADAGKERAKGRLVMLAGDFNEPSHLDWTEATKNLYDHHGTVIPWQSTTLLEQAGYLDAYRVKYPDPVTHPGFTWPSDNPAVANSKLTWAPEADERDRIDYVFYLPDERLRLSNAIVVGPSKSILRNQRVQESGQDAFLQPQTGWPTDHKSVMATFVIQPLALGISPLADAQQNVAVDAALTVVGGTAPFTYTIVAGALPPGLNLGADGRLSGTPQIAGTFAFTVQVQDANGSNTQREYVVDVKADPSQVKLPGVVTFSATPNPSRAGESVTFSIAVTAETVSSVAAKVTKAGVTPTGTVTFTDNGATIGSIQLSNGSAEWSTGALAVGNHSIVASYDGDAQVAPASMQLTQTVVRSAPLAATPVPALEDTLLWALAGLMLLLGARRLKA